MSEDSFDSKDAKTLLLWLLVGLVGAGIAFKFFFVAFPEAAVDFRVSRPAAVEVARKFLVGQGLKLEGYQSSIVFRVDDDAKTYLEREVGLAQANRLMASEVKVWYWSVRFFRPLQQEEFQVRVDPSGRVIGMSHTVEEAREGARLEKDAARSIAENFLRGTQAGLAAYEYLPEEANSTERPKRLDWSFSWERRIAGLSDKAKDAPYRLRVTLQGEQVGGFGEFLKVPEAWLRDFERLRSSNMLYQYAAQLPFAFLQGAVFLVVFDLGRRGLIRWGGALKLGLILAALFFVMNANEWPLTRSGYDTNSSYPGFLASEMVKAALISLLAGAVVSFTVAAAEPLYRSDHPQKLRLGAAFASRMTLGGAVVRFPGLRSKEFFRSCVIGLAMAGAHIGFVVAFYIVGRRFGFWVPQDLNYTDVVSTALPWIYPLAISLYAATSEEFLFRLFAIPFLLHFTKSKFVAVVLPAFIWGFLHSAYPVQPGYARGLEVGIIGIVAGWVMLRWGILATLVWHYTVDALLIGLFLLRSQSTYFRLSGALVVAFVLIPLAVAAVLYLRHRRFAADEALLNRSAPLVAPAPEAVAAARPTTPYEALTPAKLKLAVAIGAIGIALFAAVKPQVIGDFLRVRVTARDAAAQADQVLRQRNINPATFRRTTTFVPTFDSIVNEYLRREVGIAGANRMYAEKVPSAFWRVRYFRDSQKEEYAVVIRVDGRLHSVHHLLEEKAPGANLTKEEAQASAEAYLRAEKRLDLTKWKLVEANSDKRPARTDHTFVWEESESIREAHVRVELKVLGDEVSAYRIFVKIPDEWRRKQTEDTLIHTAYWLGRIVLPVLVGVGVLVAFFMNLKQQRVPWRKLARWALWGALATLVSMSNSVPLILAQYNTQWPFRTFVGQILIAEFLFLALAYSGLYILFGVAWFFLARAFGEGNVPSWRGMPAAYYRDAFWLALAGTGALLGLGRLRSLVDQSWPTPMFSVPAVVPIGFDTYIPALHFVAGAVDSGLFLVGAIALAAGVLGWPRLRDAARPLKASVHFLVLLLLSALLAGRWGSPADFAKTTLLLLFGLGIIWWGITRVVRFNLLAYFLILVTLSLVTGAGQLLRQPNAFYRFNGYAVVGVVLVFLAWPLLAWRNSRGGADAGQALSHAIPPERERPPTLQ